MDLDPVITDDGMLVRITRVPDSRLKAKTTKRHGTQCKLRRYDLFFPALDGPRAYYHWPDGWVTADHQHSADVRERAIRSVPFWALVSYRIMDGDIRVIHIQRLLSDQEATALIHKARRIREDEEWEAAEIKLAA